MFHVEIAPSILEVSHKRIEHPQKSVYFNHIHNHCELLLFISGQADYNIDGQICTPSPFDLLFIPSATYHYLIPTDSVPYENYVIGIDPAIIPPEHYQSLFTPPYMMSIQNDIDLQGYFNRLDFYNENYTEKDFAQAVKCLIEELIIFCSYRKKALTTTRHYAPTLINEIVHYITMNIQAPLNAEMIANHFMLSKSYIQNVFSQEMRIGLKRYILQKKIYSANTDLASGMAPISVCEKYGFCDYSSFYRLYKKTFGIPPKIRRHK